VSAEGLLESVSGVDAGSNVPDPDCLVEGVAEEIGAVEADGQAADGVEMSFDSLLLLLLSKVEDLDLVINASSEQAISVEAEFDAGERIFCFEASQFFFGTGFPHLDHAIVRDSSIDLQSLLGSGD
jgi:hypothetical protein